MSLEEQEEGEGPGAGSMLVPPETTPTDEQRDYDVELYARLLLNSYASRLAVAFTTEDFGQLFRIDGQMSLFDRPLEAMQLRWIRCPAPASSNFFKEQKNRRFPDKLPRWMALSAERISQVIWRDIGTSSVFQFSHSFVQQDSVLRQDTWSMRQEMPEKAPPKTFEKEKEYHQE